MKGLPLLILVGLSTADVIIRAGECQHGDVYASVVMRFPLLGLAYVGPWVALDDEAL